MERSIAVYLSAIYLVVGARTEHSYWVVIVMLAWIKGSLRIQKQLIFSYFAYAPLIQLTQTRPLMAWPKLKGSIGVVVESFHDGGCKAPGWDVLVQRMCAVI